ncbi:MAG: DEAD/DEAH box helicase family protein [Leptospiraceae bacterium]|nr:DEAD/DEAH box helicase family protein [Leptospiraceae bacterium]MCP5493783.1 DEAD/DEAH box helicase family protein [Leptospiraceae bacterium]
MNQSNTKIDMQGIDVYTLSSYHKDYSYSEFLKLIDKKEIEIEILSAESSKVNAIVKNKSEQFNVTLHKINRHQFQTGCDCKDDANLLCFHKAVLFTYLQNKYNRGYFTTIGSLEEEKSQLLSEYGFTLEDKWEDKFKIDLDYFGELKVRVLDPSIQKISQYNNWKEFSKRIDRLESREERVFIVSKKNLTPDYVPCFVFQMGTHNFPYFQVHIVAGLVSKQGGLSSLEYCNFQNVYSKLRVSQEERKLIEKFSELTDENIVDYIATATNSQVIKQRTNFLKKISDSHERLARNYLINRAKGLFDLLKNVDHVYVITGTKVINSKNLIPIQVSTEPAQLCFRCYYQENLLVIEPEFLISGVKIPLNDTHYSTGTLLLHNDKLYVYNHHEYIDFVMALGRTKCIKVHKSDMQSFIRDFVLPLQKKFEVTLPEDFPVEEIETIQPKASIYVSDSGDNYLRIKPVYEYETTQVEFDNNDSIINEKDGKFLSVVRDKFFESDFYNSIKNLHPDFEAQNGQPYFYISFEDALKDGWFFDFYNKIHKMDIPVYGFNQLKRFKYSPVKPNLKLNVSSGLDWFDVNVEVTFDKYKVPLNELKRAVVNQKNYVQLADGTYGILPSDWLEKYTSLFKYGSAKEGESIQISKYHLNVIDELYDAIDDTKLLKELDEKKKKLSSFSQIENVKLPINVKADLRPYQKESFNWFNFLHTYHFGGCLADDMGLGKTLQTLVFLQHLKNNSSKKSPTHLIVCPTSLIFNWESEIQKFCPELKYYVNHGSERMADSKQFAQFDLVLTTYGTLRVDIEEMSKFTFYYTILDESQAIKNPTSKVYKAVQLLKSKHRLVLTGTPVQNNTFDLYAQMNFLNPGLLGSIDFFKTEFSTPIDKNKDKRAATELKKLIHPFILRRTKEQVAKDLPEKIESIIFCEMGEAQKKVYESFKLDIREKIMSKIKTEGMGKAGIYILQGLSKLRQICDSPAILKEDVKYDGESIKLEELIREIEENVGEHKALVFSQFLGMLGLIKERLEQANIQYEYLDGSTKDRKTHVNRFQSDPNIRVFLISLTAGGVGLNLTAADYVYLVDPWWNPAVEQQAIDRTHRIGQSKTVIAYKMICKDTIEEKILKLQENKKSIAKEIIKDEDGFIKKLTQSDIEFLLK